MRTTNSEIAIFILSIVLAFTVLSCKDNSTNPEVVKNVIVSGQVSLKDEDPYLIDLKSGVTVQLEGTSFITTTDSLGYWILKGIPAGTYNVQMSYAGYVPTRYIGFEFNRYTTTFFSSLGKLPSFNVDSINATVFGDSIVIVGKLSNTAPHRRRVMVYLYADSTVSNEVFRFGMGTDAVATSSSTFRLCDKDAPIRLNGFPTSGMRVYMAAYGLGGGSYVTNMQTGTGYATDVSSVAARASFIMP